MKSICLFALALASASAQTGPNELNEQGLRASRSHDYAAAEKLFTQSISEWRAKGPAYDLHAAIVRTNLAEVYAARGDRIRCAATMEQALDVFRRALGVRDTHTIGLINALGGVYMMLGNDSKASALFHEVLPIERELFPSDVELDRTLSGLASLALRQNRPADGIPLAEEALAISIKATGEDSLDTALAYSNVAECHRVLGRPERAAPLFRKARAIYEKQLGPDHPRVVSILTQEALMAYADGKLATAEAALTHALSLLAQSCPACGFERVAAENDLALVRLRQGKLEEAAHLLGDVLASQEHAAGLPPNQMAVTLTSLASVRRKEKRYDEAERLQRRADLLMSTYR